MTIETITPKENGTYLDDCGNLVYFRKYKKAGLEYWDGLAWDDESGFDERRPSSYKPVCFIGDGMPWDYDQINEVAEFIYREAPCGYEDVAYDNWFHNFELCFDKEILDPLFGEEC